MGRLVARMLHIGNMVATKATDVSLLQRAVRIRPFFGPHNSLEPQSIHARHAPHIQRGSGKPIQEVANKFALDCALRRSMKEVLTVS